MKKHINSLKNTHSESIEGLSNHLVKLSIDSINYPMTFLFDMIVEQSTFPSIWKLFKIIALFKSKGSKEDPSNYRPITLLNPLSKLIEKEIYRQIDEHMKKYNLWSRQIYTYRQHHNTTSALMDIIECWSDNINNNRQNLTAFLNLSSAFDYVSHQSLETKMRIYNFSDQTVKLMSSYLSHRSQTVMVGGKHSDYLWVKHGVAQGSIIGPLMYNLYTQEIPHILHIVSNFVVYKVKCAN